MTRGDDAGRNMRDLVRLLAEAEHDFGKSLPYAPMMIDPGEPKILERCLAYKLKEPGMGGLRRNGAGTDFFEQVAELVTVHRPK